MTLLKSLAYGKNVFTSSLRNFSLFISEKHKMFIIYVSLGGSVIYKQIFFFYEQKMKISGGKFLNAYKIRSLTSHVFVRYL